MIAAVVGPFAEAVRATFQPCTFLLIAPTLTAVVAARARWGGLVAATIAGVVGGWILIDNRWILEGWQLRVSALLVGILLVLLVAPRVRELVPRLGDQLGGDGLQAASVGAIALIATMWWRPCVGLELGAILNGAQDGALDQLVPITAYMLGALLPVALLVAVRYAIAPPERVVTRLSWLFGVLGCVLAASLVAGWHDDVVVALTRWTLE